MKKTIKRILFWPLAVIVGYFAIGILLSDFGFPAKKIDYSNYFQPGDRLHSDTEGFDQTILSHSDGWVQTRLAIRPQAPGPPVHLHENFEESFTVKQGTLSIEVNGQVRTLKPGETIRIPRLTPHRPFNETDETVIVESDDDRKSIPDKFAYYLSQLYPFVDKLGKNPGNFPVIMQFSVYGDDMDTWIADGPPIFVQKSMRFLLAPTARLLGYKNLLRGIPAKASELTSIILPAAASKCLERTRS